MNEKGQTGIGMIEEVSGGYVVKYDSDKFTVEDMQEWIKEMRDNWWRQWEEYYRHLK